MKNKLILLKDNWLVIFIITFGIYLIFINPLIGRFGNEQIGSFFEKDNYETKYYINLFTEKKLSKNYRLIADIEKNTECIKLGRDESECNRIYYVRKIYWENGGYFTFDSNECLIESEEKFLCYPDQQEEGIYIEPTTKKVE